MRLFLLDLLLVGVGCSTALQAESIALTCPPRFFHDLDGDGASDMVGSACIALAPDFALQTMNNATGGLFAGDLEGDEDPDLIALSPAHNLLFFENKGGAFVSKLVSSPVQDIAIEAAADFNRDGALDLLVRPLTKNDLSILFQQEDGSFVERALNVGVNTLRVEVGDLNQDEAPDLVLSHEGAQLRVFLNNGDGSFAAPQIHPFSAHQLALSDLDQDGDVDLAALSEEGLVIFANDGAGDLSQASINASGALGFTSGFALRDLNQDNLPDAVIGAVALAPDEEIDFVLIGTVGILKNTGDLTFEVVQKGEIPVSDQYDLRLFVEEIDGDHLPDLLSVSPHQSSLISGLSFD